MLLLRLLFALLAATGCAATAARKNCLFIVSDDLRTDLGCYGGHALTPNIDKLANSSGTVLFERAYVQQVRVCLSHEENFQLFTRDCRRSAARLAQAF